MNLPRVKEALTSFIPQMLSGGGGHVAHGKPNHDTLQQLLVAQNPAQTNQWIHAAMAQQTQTQQPDLTGVLSQQGQPQEAHQSQQPQQPQQQQQPPCIIVVVQPGANGSGTPATEQNDFAITQGNQSVLEPEGLKAIKKIGKNRKDKDKTRQFTFTEYEVGISSTRGRPRKYGKGDEGDGSRKQGIPRC